MNPKNGELRVRTHWRMTDGKLSAAWLRLIARLSASRESKPSSAGQPTGETQAEKQENTKTSGTEEERQHKAE